MGIRSANPISAPSRIFRFPLKTCNLAARIVYAGDENLLDQSLNAYGTDASRHRYNSSRSFQGPALKRSHRRSVPSVPYDSYARARASTETLVARGSSNEDRSTESYAGRGSHT